MLFRLNPCESAVKPPETAQNHVHRRQSIGHSREFLKNAPAMTNPTASPSQAASDTSDWLGYGAYADALWSRTMRALDKDKDGKKPLGDDPLVIGIFGEWGAGKSALLKLVHKRAEANLAAQIANRAKDPGFSLTVPVWFQPWKYEHEEHLHVPMVVHVLNALKDAVKAGSHRRPIPG